jgi:hypothetical protein
MVQSVLSAQHADWVNFMCWGSSRTGQAVEEDATENIQLLLEELLCGW